MVLLAASVAHAEVAVELDVTVDTARRRATVRTHIAFDNDQAQPLTEVVLWRYASRFSVRSPKLNDYNFHWVYPGTFSPGRMAGGVVRAQGRPMVAREEDHADAGPKTVWRGGVPPPPPPRGPVARC